MRLIEVCLWSGRIGASARGVALIFYAVCVGQMAAQTKPPEPCKYAGPFASPAATRNPQRHIFGIFPNYNTSPCLSPYEAINSKDKFRIASEDALDPGGIVLAAMTGGLAQLSNSNRPFEQEASGYARYFGAAYANHVIGDFLTEGFYPSLLHQDPRYFRRGTGSAGSRVGYAISRAFRTQRDTGGTAFNYSQMLGATSAVAISSLYYAHHRDAAGAAVALSAQLGGAMAANILKEFWPDISRRFSRKH